MKLKFKGRYLWGHIDRQGASLNGWLAPCHGVRVTPCNEGVAVDQPCCEYCHLPDSYCSVEGLNKPGMPYTGLITYRDNHLNIWWVNHWPFVRLQFWQWYG